MHARTMALLEFACPPLPIANGQRIESNQPVIINSHDLLSTFMVQAFKQKDDKWNIRRKEAQEEIERNYYTQLEACDANPRSVYKIMSEYTRQYLSTFLLHPFTIQDVHVMPVEFISPVMLDDIYSYHKALRVLHCPDSPRVPKTNVENHLRGCCHIIRAKTTQKPPPTAVTHPSADLSLESDAQ